MSHYAQLDENNVVVFVIHAKSNDKEDEFTESTGDVYRQTSYNTYGGVHLLGGTPLRFNYAGTGYTFDPDKGTDGAFISPKPYSSWVLVESSCLWEAPVAYPTDGAEYNWDEENTQWAERV